MYDLFPPSGAESAYDMFDGWLAMGLSAQSSMSEFDSIIIMMICHVSCFVGLQEACKNLSAQEEGRGRLSVSFLNPRNTYIYTYLFVR
jgi:hypothetical protein